MDIQAKMKSWNKKGKPPHLKKNEGLKLLLCNQQEG